MERTSGKPEVWVEDMDMVPSGYRAFLKQAGLPAGMWGTRDT